AREPSLLRILPFSRYTGSAKAKPWRSRKISRWRMKCSTTSSTSQTTTGRMLCGRRRIWARVAGSAGEGSAIGTIASGKGVAGRSEQGRAHAPVRAEGDQQRLVVQVEFQDAGQEARLGRSGADLGGPDA